MKPKPVMFINLHGGYKPETNYYVFKDVNCYTCEEYSKIKKEENKRIDISARVIYLVISLLCIAIRLFVWIKFEV